MKKETSQQVSSIQRLIGRVLVVLLMAIIALPVASLAQTGGTPSASEATPMPTERDASRLQTQLTVKPSRPLVRVSQDSMTAPLSEVAQRVKQAQPVTTRQLTAPPQANYEYLDYGSVLQQYNWTELGQETFDDITAYPTNFGTLVSLYTDTTVSVAQGWSWIDLFGERENLVFWPFAGGDAGLNATQGYPADRLSVLSLGPLDLSEQADALLGFGLWYDIAAEGDDALYMCAAVADGDLDCFDLFYGQSNDWTDQLYFLDGYAGYSEVYIYWVFVSDETQNQVNYGPFLDQVVVWGLPLDAEELPAPQADPAGLLISGGDFETDADLANWLQISDVDLSADLIKTNCGLHSPQHCA